MAMNEIRQQARKSAAEWVARLRQQRADLVKKQEELSATVMTALAERDAVIADTERSGYPTGGESQETRPGDGRRSMLDASGLRWPSSSRLPGDQPHSALRPAADSVRVMSRDPPSCGTR